MRFRCALCLDQLLLSVMALRIATSSTRFSRRNRRGQSLSWYVHQQTFFLDRQTFLINGRLWQIYNTADGGDQLLSMALPAGHIGSSVTIPAVFIGESNGESLKNQANLVATAVSLQCGGG